MGTIHVDRRKEGIPHWSGGSCSQGLAQGQEGQEWKL